PGLLAVGLLLGLAPAGVLAAAPPSGTAFAAERPAGADGPAPPASADEPEEDAKKCETDASLFCPRNRHALNFIYSRALKHFDIIGWASRPDLLTLADLTSWPQPSDFDIDWGLNFNIRWWAGPHGDPQTPVPNLPPRVYDLNLQFSWRQRWADGVATEVTLL